MNGSLPLITVRPLKRPEYTYTKGVSVEDWLKANDEALRSWYEATSEWTAEEHYADWRSFCEVQFDLARDLDERLVDGLFETLLAESDAEDEPWDKEP